MSKTNQRCDAAAPSFGRQIAGVAAIAALSVAGVTDAAALDIGSEPGLITETVASRDRLKFYDDIKKYGVEAISERDRKFLMPDGIRLNNFMLFPWAEEAVSYDDNIFGDAKNPTKDWRNEFLAALNVQSALPRHVLDFNLNTKLISYLNNSDQNYGNVSGSMRSAVHVDHANTIGLTVLSELNHEERHEVTSPVAAGEPVPIWHNRATVGWTHDAGKLYGTVSFTADHQNFYDVDDTLGRPLDQDIRDQLTLSSSLRAGYRFSPGYEAIGKVRALRSTNAGEGLLNRDANGIEVLAGVSWETNPIIKWELLGGLGWRDYDRSDLATIQTELLEAHVRWLPTQRLSLYGTAKSIIDDTLDGVEDGGRITREAQVRAEYEIYHDLVATAGVGVKDTQFINDPRSDLTYEANAGLQYYYSKNTLFTLDYTYENRDSNENLFDLQRNVFRIGGRLRF